MKKLFNYARLITAATCLTVATGCTTTTTTDSGTSQENLLASAGFQQRSADTPKKQHVLQTLPKGQLSLITWKGKTYYVQPDSTNLNVAWVGTPAEFQAYQQLRLAKQLSNENLMAAQMDQNAMIGWGAAWGPGFYGGFGRFR